MAYRRVVLQKDLFRRELAAQGSLTAQPLKNLTFNAVDELAFAAMNGRPLGQIPIASYAATALGPMLEYLSLLDAGALPESAGGWLTPTSESDLLAAWRSRQTTWLSQDRRKGIFRTQVQATNENALTGFLMAAQRSARDVAGLQGTTPGQMAAAMEELEGNIQEHSNAPASGLVAFRATSNLFEFVVGDGGIGLLASLRQNPAFLSLDDHGRALASALTDGTSRYQDALRGHGFRPIFQGLTNIQGYLRFRSGDHALVMDGTGPSLATAQISQKAFIPGFFASVSCRAGNTT